MCKQAGLLKYTFTGIWVHARVYLHLHTVLLANPSISSVLVQSLVSSTVG